MRFVRCSRRYQAWMHVFCPNSLASHRGSAYITLLCSIWELVWRNSPYKRPFASNAFLLPCLHSIHRMFTNKSYIDSRIKASLKWCKFLALITRQTFRMSPHTPPTAFGLWDYHRLIWYIIVPGGELIPSADFGEQFFVNVLTLNTSILYFKPSFHFFWLKYIGVTVH